MSLADLWQTDVRREQDSRTLVGTVDARQQRTHDGGSPPLRTVQLSQTSTGCGCGEGSADQALSAHVHAPDISRQTGCRETTPVGHLNKDPLQLPSSSAVWVRANAPRVPEVLSNNPYDPDFIFERNVWDPQCFNRSHAEIRQENELLNSLDEPLANDLERMLHEQRSEIRKAWTLQKGRDWDPRPDLGVFTINGQVWRWKDSRPPLGPNDSVPVDHPKRGMGVPAQIDDDSVGGLDILGAEPQAASVKDLNITLAPSGDIIHNDNRELISSLTGYTLTQWPWRCIGPGLFQGPATPQNMRCTGWKLYDRIVVTAGHCIYPAQGAVIGWTAGADPLGPKSYPYPITLVGSAVHSYYVDYGWDGWDLGVLILPNQGWVAQIGNLGIDSGISLSKRRVRNYGYPDSQQVCAARAGVGPWDPQSRCGGSLYGMQGKVMEVFGRTFTHNCDTQPGHSGSPVYRTINGNIYVVGVHSSSTPFLGYAVRLGKDKHNWLRPFRHTFSYTQGGWDSP